MAKEAQKNNFGSQKQQEANSNNSSEFSKKEPIDSDSKSATDQQQQERITKKDIEVKKMGELLDILQKEKNNEGKNSKENIETKIGTLQENLEQSQDKYFRMAAEFDNYKKRQFQQSLLKEQYANEAIAKDLFNVIDSLEIALKHIDKEKNTKNFDEFVRGIHLVHQQLIGVFKQHHIKKMNVLGEKFDPAKHEAVATVETDKIEENKIFSVFKAGYFLHDRVIRPAVVQVSKRKQE